jgi:hypothetical protein
MVVLDLQTRSMMTLDGDDPPKPGSVLLMNPGAAIENRFFFYTNEFSDYPVVREYRLTIGGDG